MGLIRVVVTRPDGSPVQGVTLEIISTATLLRQPNPDTVNFPDGTYRTNNSGEVIATATGPFFVKPRMTGERHRVVVTGLDAASISISDPGGTFDGDDVEEALAELQADIVALAGYPYVTIGNVAGLAAERALTAGSGIQIVDGGGNSTVTVKLGNLTEKWDQTGAFDIQQRGGNIVIANGKDLQLYSDNIASPVDLLASWDAATGHIAIGASAVQDATKPINVVEVLATSTATGLFVDLASSAYAGGGIFFGAKYTVRGQATTLTQGTLGGFQVLIAQEQAGAISNLLGLTVKGQSSASSGAITSWSVLRAEAQAWNATGGIPVTSHVIDANDQGKSGTTTAYGLRIRTQTGTSSRSFIANALTLGRDLQPAAGVLLDVYGYVGVKPPSGGTVSGLLFYEDEANGSNYVGLLATNSRSNDLFYRLPGTDPVTGQRLWAPTPSGGVSALSWVDDEDGIEFIIDGGGSVITTGEKGHLEVPFDCTVNGWTIVGDVSGSIVVDMWKDTYANFPPTVADTIAGTEKPTLSSVQKNQDLALSSFTTTLTKGDWLAYNVDSASTVKRVTVSLRVKRR